MPEPGQDERRIAFDQHQLRAKFKHAAAFGILGRYSAETAQAFATVLENHVRAPETRVITGTYRGTLLVRLFLDPENRRMVMTDRNGEFISAWLLSDEQIQSVLGRGTL